MAKERKRTRVRSKIDELPREVKLVVDGMLADVTYTYKDISEYLCENGYEISYGAVFRYAQRTSNAAQRIIEAQEQTKAIIEIIKQNPNVDYTEGALQMVSAGLTQKIAAAQEEFENLSVDKAAKILISLTKTKSYKDKVYSELNEKMQAALESFKAQVYSEILDKDPMLAERLAGFAEQFAETFTEN